MIVLVKGVNQKTAAAALFYFAEMSGYKSALPPYKNADPGEENETVIFYCEDTYERTGRPTGSRVVELVLGDRGEPPAGYPSCAVSGDGLICIARGDIITYNNIAEIFHAFEAAAKPGPKIFPYLPSDPEEYDWYYKYDVAAVADGSD